MPYVRIAQHELRASQAAGADVLGTSHGPGRVVRTRTIPVAFLVNGTFQSAMGVRARSFAARLGERYEIHIAYRDRGKLASIGHFLRLLFQRQPELVYVFDMAYSGVVAALLYKGTARVKVITDTGDAISGLAKSIGRSPLGCWLTRRLEEVSLLGSDAVVVRGTYHRTLLMGHPALRGGPDRAVVEVIPDGVDPIQFKPTSSTHLRRQYGLDGHLVIGTLGTSVWNERLGTCYGWDMLEALHLLASKRVKAVMIGGGSGIEKLKERARRWGLEERVVFLDYVPYDRLPTYLGMMDVCLSKQTNDVVGQVRTTGKLPLYLACGKFVLATRVGEAARVLPEEMLIPYEGVRDEAYPARLAERIAHLLEAPHLLDCRDRSVALARQHFDYEVLACRMDALFGRILEASPERCEVLSPV